jgi:hypothetical protein
MYGGFVKMLDILNHYTFLTIAGLSLFILFFLLSFVIIYVIKKIIENIEISQKIKIAIKQNSNDLHFDFYDMRTKRIYYKLLFNDKNGEFHRFLNEINKENAFYITNKIPDNYHITFVAFQATEYYINRDKRYLEKLFYGFARIVAKKNNMKYYQLKKQIDEIIDKLTNNKYIFSSNTMPDFELVFKDKIIDRIKIFLDTIGAGLFRIGYNVYLTDDFMYKYWLLVTNDFNNLLKISKVPIINSGRITFNYGYNIKATEITNFQKTIQKAICKKIKGIAPGVFIKKYNTIPTVIVLEKEKINYLIKVKNVLLTEQEETMNNAFYTILRNDSVDNIKDFYYNKTDRDIYVPLKIDNYLSPSLHSKHFRTTGHITPTNLLFVLDITANLYKIQYYLVEKAKNVYFDKTIKGKLFWGVKINKEVDQIEALTKLIEDTYDIEKHKYLKPHSGNLKYYVNIDTEYESEYFEDYMQIISGLKAKIENEMPKLKDIYDKQQNKIFQIIGIILSITGIIFTIMTIFQTFWEHPTKNEEKKEIHEYYIEK